MLLAATAQAAVVTVVAAVGGRVTSSVGGIDCPGVCSADLSGFVEFTAIPAFGYSVDSWLENGNPVFAGASLFTFVSAPYTLQAVFIGPPSFPPNNGGTLTVLQAGSIVVAAGGAPAPTVTLSSGTLPTGLSLAPNGTISGTPASGTVGPHVLTLSAFNPSGFLTGPYTLTIAKRTQAIAFGVPVPATVPRSAVNLDLQATSTSTLPVVVTTSTPSVCVPWFDTRITFVGTGQCDAQLNQAGNADWDAAPAQAVSIQVQSAPVISSPSVATRGVGVNGSFAIIATGYPAPTIAVVGTLPRGMRFDADSAQLFGAPLAGTVGTYMLQVTASNGVAPAWVQNLEFTVTKGTQTLSPPAVSRLARLGDDSPFDLDASSTGFLPVAYSTSTPSLCSVSGGRVTLTGAHGDCAITATQAGDADYFAATSLPFTIRVGSARIDTVAGGGVLDGGPANVAPLDKPSAVAVLPNGALLIADTGHDRVRIVNGTGISTFAGTGTRGFSGDGGPATSARLDAPGGIVVDAAGNAYIADSGNHRIRRVAPNGTITTVAGDGRRAVSGDGGPATAASLSSPRGLAIDPSGRIHFIDAGRMIRRFTVGGTIEAVAGNRVLADLGDGGPATSAAFFGAYALAFDSAGHLYVSTNGRVRRISASTGTISTVAGGGNAFPPSPDGTPAITASLGTPLGIAIDAANNLLIAENTTGLVRRVDAVTGLMGTVGGGGSFPGGNDGDPASQAYLRPDTLAVGPGGALYVVDRVFFSVTLITGGTFSTVVNKIQLANYAAGDGGTARNARLLSPSGLARDAAGNLYIAERDNFRVRKVSPAGTITTLAGSGTGGYSGDGGPATAAQLFAPAAVAVDAAGNVYIADTGNARVRKVTPQGTISTFAGNGTQGTSTGDGGPATSASFQALQGVAMAPDGRLHIVESGRVRRIATDGVITTVAGTGTNGFSGDGGLATAAQISPVAIAFDAAGNLYIVDYGNVRIRKVTPAGIISTVAGSGANGYSGDGGPATSATFRTPTTVAADPFGNLYIGDGSNEVVRRVDGATGIITSLTASSESPFDGDATAPGAVNIGRLEGLVTDALGNLYIADTPFHVVRKVTFDSQPAAFAFTAQSGVPTSSVRQSATIVPASYDSTAVVTVSGGEYSVGCTATFTSAQGAINPGQSICVRHTASAGVGVVTTTTLSIGGVTGQFTSTTAAAAPANPPRLANISTRGTVRTGQDVMIGGFIIEGATSKRVAIVATGPSLGAHGIPNPLLNPTMLLVRSSDQAVIATNDDWGQAANAAQLTAAGLAPSHPQESALLIDLPAGAYTAVVSGVGNTTGVALVAVYEVDHPESPLINISTRGKVLTGFDVMIGGFIIQGNGPQTVAIVATGPSLAAFGIPGVLANPTITLVRSSDQTVVASNDDWASATNAAQLTAEGFAPSHPNEAALLVTLQPGAYTAIVSGVGGGTGVALIAVYAVD